MDDGRGAWISSAVRGVPDIVGLHKDGRFIGIEVKTSTGRVSPEQTAFLDAIRARNGIALVARKVEDVGEL